MRSNDLNFFKIVEDSFTFWFESGAVLFLVIFIVLQLKVSWSKIISVEIKCYVSLYLIFLTESA